MGQGLASCNCACHDACETSVRKTHQHAMKRVPAASANNIAMTWGYLSTRRAVGAQGCRCFCCGYPMVGHSRAFAALLVT
eukprot:1158046-Pelagomonas_calceolata.AAC.10